MLKTEVINLLKEEDTLHINDPRRSAYYDRILDLLLKDEAATIDFIESVTEGDLIFSASTFFGALAGYFKSEKLIKAIERFYEKHKESRYAELVLLGVEQAKNAMG